MKKPRKPQKLRVVIRYIGILKVLNVLAPPGLAGLANIAGLKTAAIPMVAKTLGIPREEVELSSCYYRQNSLYYNVVNLSDEIIKAHFGDATLCEVKKYFKKCKVYQSKLKQYEINMGVWRAWKLKDTKDKTIEQIRHLEKELVSLQDRVEQIDCSIEEAINA